MQFIPAELENANVFNNSQINNPEYIAFKCFIYFNEILLKEVLQCQATESTLYKDILIISWNLQVSLDKSPAV